jgi:pectate lyase
MNVTGGGANPEPIEVKSGKNKGADTLAKAIEQANGAGGKSMEIVITTTIEPNEDTDLTIRAKNLTIRAVGNAIIKRNHLVLDCTQADNILLTNLHFASDGDSKPNDSISIVATEGRGKTGFWIDHCTFEAYFDLSITSNTRDKVGAPPLLITVSNCHFFDKDPDGKKHRNHGALGIHGTGRKDKDSEDKARTQEEDKNTNAYATVYRNFFENVRRRSPRSSNRTFVHAFNNVLKKWGTSKPGKDTDQENGMSAGHFGILAAEANYFLAGALKEAIEITNKAGEEPRLLVGAGNLINVYANGAIQAENFGTPPIDILQAYQTALGPQAAIPRRDPMSEDLRKAIEKEAGAR